MKHVGVLLLGLALGMALVVADVGEGRAAIEPDVDALWDTSVVPDVPNWPDENSVELGVRFTTSEPIWVVGVRFYKGDLNTGTHLGTLWSTDGSMLATGEFTNETSEGWQDLIFEDAVPMAPGDVYIASYWVPFGYYSAVNDYFFDDLVSGPVTALASVDAAGNGVYSYSTTSTFPTFTYRASNYWVTPLWTTNQPPVVDAGTDRAGDEGSKILLEGSVVDPDSGDQPTIAWRIDAGPDDGGACTFEDATSPVTSVSCDDDGTVVATLTADDGINPPVSDSVTISVSNVAPTAAATVGTGDGSPFGVGQAVPVAYAIADPGTNDTYSCVIDWGDGLASEVSGEGCAASHAYTEAGVYVVGNTVTDDDGGESRTESLVVVYDPDAGFVTGGGWIHSAPGAYVADPEASGKATFGFVSKYKKGQSRPTGNTTFRFSAGALTFHSDSYEWLVVTGSDSAMFKGSGSVNGVEGYSFRIWAGDDSPDTFRIKIWQESASGTEEIVYDNGSDQPLGGGRVVIHRK